MKKKENKLVVYYAAGDVIPFILFQLISFNCYLISSPIFSLSLSLFLICLAANKERKKKNAEATTSTSLTLAKGSMYYVIYYPYCQNVKNRRRTS
jgi:hypothetical protein